MTAAVAMPRPVPNIAPGKRTGAERWDEMSWDGVGRDETAVQIEKNKTVKYCLGDGELENVIMMK